jgi:hypothetical protein
MTPAQKGAVRWSAAEDATLLALVAAGGLTAREMAARLRERFPGRGFEKTGVLKALKRLRQRMSAAADSSIAVTSSAPEPEPYADIQDVLPAPPDRTFVDKSDESAPGAYEFAPLDLGSRQTERVLLLPDIHTPFHDKHAWALACAFARAFEPDTVVQLGDWIDCYTVSDHDKDPRRVHQLEDEAKEVRAQREELEALPSVQRLIRTRGNHEWRFTSHLLQKAPALLSSVSLDGICGWDNGKWRNVPYLSHGMLGKLAITHCADKHVYGAGAVRSAATMFNASVAFGHTHRLGLEYFGDILGRRHVSVSLGCLADIAAADYASVAQKRFWTLGFGEMYLTRDGRFTLHPLPIVGNRIYYGERLVEL